MNPDLSRAVADSVDYLRSPRALASLENDPYWPKWDSPWWHVLALEEAGEVAAIPRSMVQALMDATGRHYVPFFPKHESELPPGKDFYAHVICHCALGLLLRALLACGLNGEAGIPWAKGWFLRYLFPDGGFNCDEKAYSRAAPKSSLISTLPPLEYLLALGEQRPLTADEVAILDGGAAYLLAHRVVCSASTGNVIRADWLVPSLPRFYEYDALRGLAFLVRWAERRRRPFARRDVALALSALERHFGSDPPPGPRRWHVEHQTRAITPSGEPGWGPSSSFALLEAMNAGGRALLEEEWREAKRGLERLEADGLVS